jgi:hypothetical protein
MAFCALSATGCSQIAARYGHPSDPNRFAPRHAPAVKLDALPPGIANGRHTISVRGDWTMVRLHDGRVFYLHRNRVFALRSVPKTDDFPIVSNELVEVSAKTERTIRSLARRPAARSPQAAAVPAGTLVVRSALPRAVGDHFDVAVAERDATALLSDDPAPAVVSLYAGDCQGCKDDLKMLPQLVERARRAHARVVLVSRSGDDPARLARSIDAAVRRDVTIVPDRSWSVFAGLDARFVPITMVVRRGRISRMYLGSITKDRLPGVLDDISPS